jgi:Zn-dependent peptidase ImmA (M78 family)
VDVYPNYGRVQRLRVARGLTQAELADHLGVPASALSRVLSGHASLDATSANQLAAVLNCTVDLLSKPVLDTLHTRPWLRAYADAPKKAVEQYVADTLLAFESFVALGLRRLPERLPAFSGDLNDETAIDEFATEVRMAADVAPVDCVPNVTRAAERLGCVVLPMDNELGRHLGMSLFIDGTPIIRVGRPSSGGGIPGDRQRFTVAHELGHVTLHTDIRPPDNADDAREIEKQAHRFAGAFLLPGDSFLTDLDTAGGRVTLATLSKLKRRWGVAIKAMVIRLQQLNRIDADHARSLYKQISARGWNKQEPEIVGNERAVWLQQAISHRFSDHDALAQAASRTGLYDTYFESWTSWESAPDAMIIPFNSRTTRRSTAQARSRDCDVTQL